MRNVVRRDNLVHWVFVVAHIASAVIAAMPRDAASKECLAGYKALCSFTPISTLISLAMVALHVVLAVRQATPGARRSDTAAVAAK